MPLSKSRLPAMSARAALARPLLKGPVLLGAPRSAAWGDLEDPAAAPAGAPVVQRLLHAVSMLTALVVGAAAAAALLAAATQQGGVVGELPRDRLGRAIPQELAAKQAEGGNILLRGRFWEPMDLAGGRPSAKGALAPDAVALLLVDMQPLFYDGASPWGRASGLEGSPMRAIWPRQLELGRRVVRFTGRNDSVFLTRFVAPRNASAAKGVMRHYYGFTPGWPNERNATAEALAASGANVSYLLDVMPELQPLVVAGARVSTKLTPGAFGQDSTLPRQLEEYFRGVDNDRTKTLIIAGVETDYCVLSTVLGAIDRYYRVILVTDAVGSTQPNAELAQFDYTFRRFDHMMDLAESKDVAAALA